MGRSFDKHIDNAELDALVPWSAASGEQHALSPDARAEAERHLSSCVDCSRKVAKYRELVNQLSGVKVSEVTAPGAGCPKDIEWYEVAAGLWPELKATQLISHAATCQHCGPLLRAATSVDDDPTPQEENLLAQLKAPARPDIVCPPVPIAPALRPKPSRNFIRWLIPAVALILIVGVLITRSTPLSGSRYAEEAVIAHRKHAQGNLPLEVRLDSQQALNEWLKAKAPFPLALPASPPVPGEERPYRLEGARLVRVGSKTAAYIAYQMQTGPASLMVTTDSVARASGGVQVDYQKVSFHYRTVQGYKVVTWSMRGKTYALVSQEGNSTQQSCMVCHSAMRDRDLTHTPAPLPADRSAVERVLQ